MQTLLWIATMVFATLMFIAIVRRLPPVVTMIGFLVVTPVALCFRSTGDDQASLFSMVKLGSVAVGAAYIQALKITRWAERPLGRAVASALLAVNILEAVIAEAAQGGLVNAAAGVLLVLTQAAPGTIHVEQREAWRELRYPLGGLWVAAYTLWNFTFIYGRESHGVAGVFAASGWRARGGQVWLQS